MTENYKNRKYNKTLVLFDVDGTLTPARESITPEMETALRMLRKLVYIGFVGGSDLNKQFEQLGNDALGKFDYCFSENGLTAYKQGEKLSTQSFINYLGELEYKNLVNYILQYIVDLNIPKKRGTFVEFRNGMINVSPIGRNCSKEERIEFEQYDKEYKIREKFVKDLKQKFEYMKLKFSIGGQISFDVFPQGWDKTYCLRHIPQGQFDEIHFFGDKTFEGGNDYEIHNHERIKGHTVIDPSDTMSQLASLFGINYDV